METIDIRIKHFIESNIDLIEEGKIEELIEKCPGSLRPGLRDILNKIDLPTRVNAEAIKLDQVVATAIDPRLSNIGYLKDVRLYNLKDLNDLISNGTKLRVMMLGDTTDTELIKWNDQLYKFADIQELDEYQKARSKVNRDSKLKKREAVLKAADTVEQFLLSHGFTKADQHEIGNTLYQYYHSAKSIAEPRVWISSDKAFDTYMMISSSSGKYIELYGPKILDVCNKFIAELKRNHLI